MSKRNLRFLSLILFIVILFTGTASVATARTVYFRRTSNWELVSFDSSNTTNWVGWGYTNKTTNVRIVQAAYNTTSGMSSTIAIDGYFGDFTYAAVKELQRYYKTFYPSLGVDGIVGTTTWSYIELFKGWYYTGNPLPF